MRLLNVLSVLMGMGFMSCEKVIEVDLDTAPPRLVIDATINWVRNTAGNDQTIKLSTTTGYYEEEFPAVSGATVFITNSTNTVFDFAETATAGEYRCADFDPVVGETYNLTVTVNGETYTAVETLTATPEIEEEIRQTNAGGFTGSEIEIQFMYQDDGSRNNYYMTRIQSSRVAFPEFSVESDEQFQGKMMSVYYAHEDLKAGDLLNIQLVGVSRRFFDYFGKLLTASGNGGSPFPTTPTAVRGNFINQTDTKNFALGYFRLSEVVNRQYTIQ